MNAALPRHEILMRQMIEVTPLRLGSRVTVRETAPYADEWRGEFVVVSMVWEYQHGLGRINVGIATDDDIVKGYGYTDGFSVGDLEPVLR